MGPPAGNCPKDGSENCLAAKCCATPGEKCYLKNSYWASCKESCTPGIDPNDPPKYQSPWDCKVLGGSAGGGGGGGGGGAAPPPPSSARRRQSRPPPSSAR